MWNYQRKQVWRRWRELSINTRTVIVIVIGAGVQTARKAMRLGALDVLSTDTGDMEHICKCLIGAFVRLSIRSESILDF